MKRLKIVAGILLLLTLAVVIGGILYLQSDAGKSTIAQLAKSAIESSVNGAVALDVTSIGLSSCTVERFSIRDPSGTLFISVEKADAELSLLSLLSGTLGVDRARLHGVTVYLRSEGGAMNVSELFVSEDDSSTSSSFTVALADVTATDVDVVYFDADTMKSAELRNSDFDPTQIWVREQMSQIKSSVGNFDALGPALIPIDELKANGKIVGSDVMIDVTSFKGNVGFSQLLGKGPLKLDAASVKVEGDTIAVGIPSIDIARRIVGTGINFKGDLDDSLWIKNHQLEADSITLSRGWLAELVPSIDPQSDIALSWKSSGDLPATVEFKTKFGFGNSKGELTGTGSNLDDIAKLRFDVSGDNLMLHVADLLPLPIDASYEGKLRTSNHPDPDVAFELGRVQLKTTDGRVTFEGESVDQLEADLRTDGEEFTSTGTSFHYEGIDVTIDGRVHSEGSFETTVVANGATSETKGVTIDADVSLRASGSFDFAAPTAAEGLQQLRADAKWDISGLKSSIATVGRSRGKVDIDLSPRQTNTRRIAVDLDATGSNVAVDKYRVSSFDADIDGAGTLKVAPLDIISFISSFVGKIDVDATGVRAPQGKVAAITARGTTSAGSDGLQFDIDASVSGVKSEFASLSRAKLRARGEAQVVAGKVRRLRSQGSFEASGVKSDGIALEQGKGRFELSGPPSNLSGDVTLEGRDVAVAGQEFEEATVVATAENQELSVAVEGVAKSTDPNDKNATPRTVKVAATARYAPGYEDVELTSVDADLGDTDWKVSDGLKIDGGRISFDDVELSNGDQKVTVDGTFDSEGQNLQVAAKDVQIETIAESLGLVDLEGIKGKVDGTATLGGTADDPTGVFSLSFRNLYYRVYGPVDLDVGGMYRDGLAELKTLRVLAFSKIEGSGSGALPIRLSRAGIDSVDFDTPFEFAFAIPNFGLSSLDSIPELESVGLTGTASLDVGLRGTLREPIMRTDLQLGEVAVSGRVGDDMPVDVGPMTASAKFTNTESQLVSDFSIVLDGGGDLTARSEVGLSLGRILPSIFGDEKNAPRYREASITATASANKFDLSKLNVGTLAEENVEGILSIDLNGTGTLQNPAAKGSIDLDGFGYGRFRDILVNGAYELTPSGLSLQNFAMGWDGDDVVTLDAAIPDPVALFIGETDWETQQVAIDVELKPIRVAKLSAFDYGFAAIPGVMRGELSMNGTPRNLRFESTFDVDDIKLGDGATGVISAAARSDAGDAQVSFDLSRDNAPGINLRASFPVNPDLVSILQEDGAVLGDGEVSGGLVVQKTPLKGLVPPALAARFVERLAGTVEADIKMSGERAAVRFNGTADVEDGALTILGIGRRFEETSVGVELQGDKIKLTNFFVRDGTGFVSGNGETVLRQWRPQSIRLKAKAHRFGLDGFSSLPAYLSGDVLAGGDVTESSTNATMTVSNLEVEIPNASSVDVFPTELDEDIIVLKNSKDQTAGQLDETTKQRNIADEIYARINVQIEDNARFKHPLGTVRFMGDLDLAMANIGPLMKGEITTLDGSFETFGKTFQVDRGVITFRGLDPPDPTLQLEARHVYNKSLASALEPPSTGASRAIIRITGKSSDPQIRFLSDPSMQEQDVIYALVTDRPPGAAGVGQTEAGLVAGAAASGLTGVASLVAGKMNKLLPKIAQVDVVRIESGNEGFTDSRLEVGKYLSPKFFLVYEYQFGAEEDENENIGRFEYRFLPRWIFEVEVGDRAQGQFNVLWEVY